MCFTPRHAYRRCDKQVSPIDWGDDSVEKAEQECSDARFISVPNGMARHDDRPSRYWAEHDPRSGNRHTWHPAEIRDFCEHIPVLPTSTGQRRRQSTSAIRKLDAPTSSVYQNSSLEISFVASAMDQAIAASQPGSQGVLFKSAALFLSGR
ncbi:hypothetical protein PHSY_004839 [Pseudozyma hubeiensis SY62]|uniref:Uncharacterized protein n=1 Tax=Pseudozyma hubeiensis (strain SY62) TaxID=1305764 RepID=R9P7E2_PSEHS|nr:hypothetical protein PHSY_004839 [Pseudozyma hubeiensis SY62]GAC97254.1 hypothetical protein PHSY_004839 [Pseudozyma hubeiensis SY62]